MLLNASMLTCYSFKQFEDTEIENFSFNEIENFLILAEIKLKNGLEFSELDKALLLYYLKYFSELKKSHIVTQPPEFWYLRQG